VVSPTVFIPSAEETGLIVEMGDIVLRKVCQKIVELRALGYDKLTFSINLSPVQFDDGRIVEKIRTALMQYDVSPSQLEMEITESLAMENFNYVNDVLEQLKNMGIRIALDDFGKGYSSLNYLKRLAIDTLKVDRDFIRDIGHDQDDEIILDHIISIAHALNLLVVAEGVETWAQFDYLAARNCNEYQGYLFSKPVPPEQVNHLLTQGFTIMGNPTAKIQ
jgi:EAL domain-containing protein (putative c-di-GMP-specific phosphodiesterase class I)